MPLIERRKRQRGPTPGGAGELHVHELRSVVFRNRRMLRVWLPPSYGSRKAARYPVLYLNDGQNLFDPATAFAGVAWQVGETAAKLVAERKIAPMILVGIDNTGENRIREYIPYRSTDPPLPKPMGQRYPAFLLREVMPFIESTYAVATGIDNTGLGGSSLGGLIALSTQLAIPGIFGRLLIESPSLFVAERRVLEESRVALEWPTRVYLGIGSSEIGNPEKDARTVQDLRELETILRAAGLQRKRLKVRVQEGAGHNEGAWAARFPEALEFLYSSTP